LLIGYFEGIDSERGIAWRTADSFVLRGCLGLDEAPPEHSTTSRTRRLIDLETPGRLHVDPARAGNGGSRQDKTIGIDATTLEANAALRRIVRRDSGPRWTLKTD
jgi:transposase